LRCPIVGLVALFWDGPTDGIGSLELHVQRAEQVRPAANLPDSPFDTIIYLEDRFAVAQTAKLVPTPITMAARHPVERFRRQLITSAIGGAAD